LRLRNRVARCYMYFQTKNPSSGKFWRVLQLRMLIYFMGIWFILHPFALFYRHLVYFVVIWYILSRFGMLYQEKSGNPAPEEHNRYVGKCGQGYSRYVLQLRQSWSFRRVFFSCPFKYELNFDHVKL
jgi:hypothetical protein